MEESSFRSWRYKEYLHVQMELFCSQCGTQRRRLDKETFFKNNDNEVLYLYTNFFFLIRMIIYFPDANRSLDKTIYNMYKIVYTCLY